MGRLLELKNFSYSYGNINAVHGIDLYVDEGEIVTIIGSNGAGKTTTLRSISGLTDPGGVGGKIIFEGKEIQKMQGNKILGLGLGQVLEGRRIFSLLTVEENLYTGAYLRKNREEVKEDLKRVYDLFPRLLERRKQLGGTLSGGEQQMLAIGRVLLSKPKMMLMDEPSLGLAPLIVKEIFERIVELRKDGMTILLVEQNSRLALSVADRGYIMQTGDILFSDYCENLVNNEDVQKAYLGG